MTSTKYTYTTLFHVYKLQKLAKSKWILIKINLTNCTCGYVCIIVQSLTIFVQSYIFAVTELQKKIFFRLSETFFTHALFQYIARYIEIKQ